MQHAQNPRGCLAPGQFSEVEEAALRDLVVKYAVHHKLSRINLEWLPASLMDKATLMRYAQACPKRKPVNVRRWLKAHLDPYGTAPWQTKQMDIVRRMLTETGRYYQDQMRMLERNPPPPGFRLEGEPEGYDRLEALHFQRMFDELEEKAEEERQRAPSWQKDWNQGDQSRLLAALRRGGYQSAKEVPWATLFDKPGPLIKKRTAAKVKTKTPAKLKKHSSANLKDRWRLSRQGVPGQSQMSLQQVVDVLLSGGSGQRKGQAAAGAGKGVPAGAKAAGSKRKRPTKEVEEQAEGAGGTGGSAGAAGGAAGKGKQKQKGCWQPSEVEELRRLVGVHGYGKIKIKLIAAQLNRGKKSVRRHWHQLAAQRDGDDGGGVGVGVGVGAGQEQAVVEGQGVEEEGVVEREWVVEEEGVEEQVMEEVQGVELEEEEEEEVAQDPLAGSSQWSEEEVARLIRKVQRQLNKKSGLQTAGQEEQEIDWQKVAVKIKTHNAKECRKEWRRQQAKSLQLQWPLGSTRGLLKALHQGGYRKEKKVPWDGLVSRCGADVTERQWQVLRRCVPGQEFMSMKQVVQYLAQDFDLTAAKVESKVGAKVEAKVESKVGSKAEFKVKSKVVSKAESEAKDKSKVDSNAENKVNASDKVKTKRKQPAANEKPRKKAKA